MAENFLPPKTDPSIYDENGVLTTFAMDGLFTQEDIDNRHYLMALCSECGKWEKMDNRTKAFKCECGSEKYNMRESRSIRSWMATKDLKKERTPRRPNKRS